MLYGYPERFVQCRGEPLTIRYALDVKFPHKPLPSGVDESIAVRPDSFTVYDAVSNRKVASGNLVVDGPGPQVTYHPCESHRRSGANYPWSSTIDTDGLQPGPYKVRLQTHERIDSLDIYLVIREAVENCEAELLIVFPTFTLQAYNRMGGASLYYPLESIRAGEVHVSLRRPFAYSMVRERAHGEIGHHTMEATLEFVRAATKIGRSFVCTDSLDVHENPELLGNVELMMLTGHDEYMTQEIRTAIDTFVESGGKLAVFSGNTCHWKVRLDDKEISVTKPARANQESDPVRRTGKWQAKHIGDPVERTFGLAYRFGGVPVERFLDLGRPPLDYGITPEIMSVAGGMQVLRPDHPLFAGTGLGQGEWFCSENKLLCVEVDGIPLNADNTIHRSKRLKSPESIEVLAAAHLCNKSQRAGALRWIGSIVEFDVGTNGGKVVNLASVGWYRVVNSTLTGHRIFRNTIDHLLGNSSHKKTPGRLEWYGHLLIERSRKYASACLHKLHRITALLARTRQ